ncbi:protein of unknown function [Tepidanaerobacter acetatoxydans Re1]|uniref:Uncharacterized protein n=1 Tax=Tepidanaerobacter acetatoxydans (strain DSM 21804 / JCM 16047 / Re1) TaxID=1209989 RepID=U4Q7X2_TEPAE|nr:protein of unknown function [Tepidanaerobacter acetatoxydans Re1]
MLYLYKTVNKRLNIVKYLVLKIKLKILNVLTIQPGSYILVLETCIYKHIKIDREVDEVSASYFPTIKKIVYKRRKIDA